MLSSLLLLSRNQIPRLTQMAVQDFIIYLIQFDADPSAAAHIGR